MKGTFLGVLCSLGAWRQVKGSQEGKFHGNVQLPRAGCIKLELSLSNETLVEPCRRGLPDNTNAKCSVPGVPGHQETRLGIIELQNIK